MMAKIADGIAGNTICALGDAAAWPMLSFLTKFQGSSLRLRVSQDDGSRNSEQKTGS